MLDYVQNVFSMLAGKDYHLNEQEAIAFIPYLVNKVTSSHLFFLLAQKKGIRFSGETKLIQGIHNKNARSHAFLKRSPWEMNTFFLA